MSADSIHVALAFDDAFWAPAYATMRSVCLATHRRSDLVFHVVHPPIPTQHVADLDAIETEFGSRVIHHDPAHSESFVHYAANLPHTPYISSIMYARLFFDHLLDESVTRIVYLDADVMVRAPIEELAEADLKDKPVGAVPDPTWWRLTNGRDLNERRDVFDPADAHFNAGVQVIDLAKWRQLDMAAVLRRLDNDGILPRLENDQDIANYVLRDNWTELDLMWNALARGQAMEVFNPKLVHYTGLNKPWYLVSRLPYARVYRHLMTNALFYRYLRYRWANWWLRLLRLRRG